MSSVRNNKSKNEEVASLCAEIVRRIKTEEDPVALNAYRAAIRKNVPFFVRSYFAAFLLKQLQDAVPGGERKAQGDRKRKREVRDPSASAPVRNEEPVRKDEHRRREDPPRRSLPEAEAATLFIGVGRNRRAYARELFSFIMDNAQVDAETIGELRVLDNFSFVQVRREAADSVIESLNGIEFRGRPVSVSYAKPRKEEPKPETQEETDTGDSPEMGETDFSDEEPDQN